MQRKAALASALDDDDTAMPDAPADASARPRAIKEDPSEPTQPDQDAMDGVQEEATPGRQVAEGPSGDMDAVEEQAGLSGRSHHVAALTGSQYEVVLLALLEGLR